MTITTFSLIMTDANGVRATCTFKVRDVVWLAIDAKDVGKDANFRPLDLDEIEVLNHDGYTLGYIPPRLREDRPARRRVTVP